VLEANLVSQGPRVIHAEKPRQPATRADLEKLPPTWRGEIIDGTLYAFPRPRFTHADIETFVAADLKHPFQSGRGGPGGWWILVEPGIEVPRAPEFSPDVAGWRREKMPTRPPEGKPITVVPDWLCEVLSPSTRSYDLVVKRRFYAEIGVGYLWYIDPEGCVLTVSKLVDGKWLELGAHGREEKVRAAPFDAVEIDLAAWWEGVPRETESPEEPLQAGR
jgi:Uma2 family endonuclease